MSTLIDMVLGYRLYNLIVHVGLSDTCRKSGFWQHNAMLTINFADLPEKAHQFASAMLTILPVTPVFVDHRDNKAGD